MKLIFGCFLYILCLVHLGTASTQPMNTMTSTISPQTVSVDASVESLLSGTGDNETDTRLDTLSDFAEFSSSTALRNAMFPSQYYFCNSGTFYSNQELNTLPTVAVTERKGNLSGFCFISLMYPSNLQPDSNFMILSTPASTEAIFSLKNMTELIGSVSKNAWAANWGSVPELNGATFHCEDKSTNGTNNICNSIDWVLSNKLNLFVTNANDNQHNTPGHKHHGEYYTRVPVYYMILRQMIWEKLYPEWKDHDYEFIQQVIFTRGYFINSKSWVYGTEYFSYCEGSFEATRMLRRNDAKYMEQDKEDRILLKFLVSEDSIDNKIGQFLTIGVICMYCLYAMLSGLVYKSVKRIKNEKNSGDYVFQS